MPDRIVSLIPSGTEIVDALGCSDRLVGRSHECDWPDGIASLPVCTAPKFDATAPSIDIDRSVRSLVENALSVYKVHEDVLKDLQPDVIVTQSQCELCAVSQTDVEASVARVLGSNTGIASMEAVDLNGLWADIRNVARSLEVESEDLIERLKSRLNAATQTIEERRPRVVCLEWIEPLMFAGNWVPELVTLAGGEDLFGSPGAHSGNLDWDQIVAADPDIILLMPCGYDLPRTLQELPLLCRLDGWDDLRAVKEGRVYATDGNHYFNRPGPRLVDSLEILVEILHPDADQDLVHRGVSWTPIES